MAYLQADLGVLLLKLNLHFNFPLNLFLHQTESLFLDNTLEEEKAAVSILALHLRGAGFRLNASQ